MAYGRPPCRCVGAVFAIAVTLGVMGLVIVALPLSVFALNLVIALGLGLSVDFSLLDRVPLS